MGELWWVFREDFGENWPCNNSTTLYYSTNRVIVNNIYCKWWQKCRPVCLGFDVLHNMLASYELLRVSALLSVLILPKIVPTWLQLKPPSWQHKATVVSPTNKIGLHIYFGSNKLTDVYIHFYDICLPSIFDLPTNSIGNTLRVLVNLWDHETIKCTAQCIMVLMSVWYLDNSWKTMCCRVVVSYVIPHPSTGFSMWSDIYHTLVMLNSVLESWNMFEFSMISQH